MRHYIIIYGTCESEQLIEITPVRLDPPTSNRVKIHLDDDDFLFDCICNIDVSYSQEAFFFNEEK